MREAAAGVGPPMLTHPRFRSRSGLGARPSLADGYSGIPQTTGKVLMADLLDSIRQQLRERLDELRPLMSEYERLVEAERALKTETETRAVENSEGKTVDVTTVRSRRNMDL